MNKTAPTPEPGAAGEAAKETAAPLLCCTVIRNRTKIGKAICAAGKRISLAPDEAKALEAAGLIRIDGI